MKWTVPVLLLATIPSASVGYADEGLLGEIRQKEAEWVQKRVWQPELPTPGGETRPTTCRVVSYGGKWTRHGFGGHGGGPCMFRYSTTAAYDPLPGVTDRTERRMKTYVPIPYDVDGDGDRNDDFVAALTFSLTDRLSIPDWPQSATFPGRYSAKFHGGYAWYVSVASDYGSLVALDRRNGKKLWEQSFGRGLAIRSAVSVSQDGLIYLGTHDHHVYCVDRKTGQILWKHKTDGPVVSSACIANGMVFIGSDDGNVYAFE